MRFVSTRSDGAVTLDEALVKGIADDGGLFVAEALPRFSPSDFAGVDSIPDIAHILLQSFFAGSALEAELDAILAEAFCFPIQTTLLPGGKTSLLELYHGPTAAFKDVGAGFLAACLTRLESDASSPLTILVATSGDTGGAVAAAFNERPGMRVVVVFPDGRVSDRQAQQLTCWGDNVLSLRVSGSFDDCQALVKAALGDETLARLYRFSSANSINIGRLLPQATYYADASLRHYRDTGQRPGFVIPTGNLGNAFACIMAREMGLPIGPIALATNANKTIPDYFESLEWQPRASIQTLASAMDVGDPSNMERLRGLLGDADVLRDKVGVRSVDDAQIEQEIRDTYGEFGFAICPHTATASYMWRHMGSEHQNSVHWILVATAHPAKFETIVEPLIGEPVPLPSVLAEILSRPSRSVTIDPTLDALASAMENAFA
ncbi:MAG: threonine synthase [Gammaproteobacteria bacterium]|nr:threonine synthase [Gammaproteobacteria bacterium]